MSQPAPPGWYRDPVGGAGGLRYWSGTAWTEHTHETGSPWAPPQWGTASATAFAAVGPLPYMNREEVNRVELKPTLRRDLGWETAFVMAAFLLPGIVGAIVLFAEHVNGIGNVTRFPVYIQDHPLENMLVGMLAYLPTACTVPIALFLLNRTGQGPKTLGLQWPGLRSDIVPALGLVAASWGTELAIALPLTPLLAANSALVNKTPIGNVPTYYIAWGVLISLTTAVAEEVLVNGYLLTRLTQLGWSPRSALILSLGLRTSYHVYYGLGFILTVPFGYFVTRSFQKNGRLTRPIVAHFLYDSILLTLSILA